jgi:hypothetical protein
MLSFFRINAPSFLLPPPLVIFFQEFSLFGHLNIENLLNLSRFESVVTALLQRYETTQQQQQPHEEEEQMQQQQQQQQQEQRRYEQGRRIWSARARKKRGDAQAFVQCPRCDSPSTDEAEVSCAQCAIVRVFFNNRCCRLLKEVRLSRSS